jgi:hypothetical protein
MVWMIVIANIVVSLLLMVWSKQVAKVAFLPGHMIVPGVILFVFMGAWLGGASLGDWISCLTMGVVGFIMKRGGWPRPPLILALILGNIMENSFQISMRAHEGAGWLTRPIVLIILALVILSIFLAARGIIKTKMSGEGPTIGEGSERNPVISFPFSVGLLGLFVWAGIESLKWPYSVQQFPLMISIPGAALVLGALWQDARGLIAESAEAGGINAAIQLASKKAILPRAGRFFGYLIAMILVMLVIGQKFALPLFIGIYLWRWGSYHWRFSLGYAIGGWLLLVLFYDQVMHLFWHQSWLSTWLPFLLPEWLPPWLFI